MFAQERHNEIYDAVQKSGAVTTSGLVSRFGVSVETIRKDLLFLEKKGLLTRVHGGAVVRTDLKPFSALPQRRKDYNVQKKARWRRERRNSSATATSSVSTRGALRRRLPKRLPIAFAS